MQYWQKLHEYLQEIDNKLDRPLEVTIIGGAALILKYHHVRVTYDIDILNAPDARMLSSFVEQHKALNEKYKIPIHVIDSSFFPVTDDFLEKRVRYAEDAFKNLKVLILDLYDLILSKLDRCNSKDRDDIQWLKENFIIDVERLIKAYQEGRRNALNPGRVDGNFLYILDAVFGKTMSEEELLEE